MHAGIEAAESFVLTSHEQFQLESAAFDAALQADGNALVLTCLFPLWIRCAQQQRQFSLLPSVEQVMAR